MATKRIRCVNADGKIRELPETLVNNRKGFMAKYGWRVEDVKAEAPIELPKEETKVETVEVVINTEEVVAAIDEKIAEIKAEEPQERVIKRRKPRTKKA